MKPNFILMTLSFLALLLFSAAGSPPVQSQPLAPTLASTYATTKPVINGSLGFGEWNLGNQIPLGNGYLTVLNDEARLYILVNLLADNGDDAGDYFWLTFDANRDGAITPGVDLNYALHPTSGNMRYQYYTGPASWTGLQPDTLSSKGKGFGCFFADGSLTFSGFPFGITCSAHRVWELGIDLAEIGATAGETIYMGLRTASSTPSFTDNVPANFYSNFSNLIEVELAGPVISLVPTSRAVISLETNPIELTQAIQTRTNSLPLVRDKTTTARVYVDVNGAGSSQNTIVYLYGTRGGVDLPGSPLAVISSAPTSINRDNLNHTANFLLPPGWAQGTVTFRARVATSRGIEDTSGNISRSFTAKDRPTYWVIPVNTGTAASPTLPNNNDINDHQNYLRTVFPVPDVTFVRKPWTAIGANAPGGGSLIQKLNDYHGTAVLAWVLSVLFTGEAPFDLPDQVYGFTPFGGGLSDPTWYNSGNGYVAWGGDASVTGNGTMAHEINHNLDRSSNGTWGRHNGGCGSSGPDSAWPYGNDDINEVGFDTVLPWVVSAGGRRTISPANTPDFMSYCGAGILPSNWISPYRWQALFNTMPAATSALSLQQAQDITEVFYLSGQVNKDGTGKLEPVLVQPGIPGEVPRQGNYTIELYGVSGKLLDVPFTAVFEDLEGEPIDTVFFSFQLPAVQGVTRIVLRSQTAILDEIVVSSNPPVVSVASPASNREPAGTLTIRWTATDPDGDPLQFTLLYSPDGGKSWYPIASGVEENSYEVDTSLLPGGAAGMIRVIATDGFNTSEGNSTEPFSLPDQAPIVLIESPETGTVLTPNEAITFTGTATDAEEEALPEEALVWSYGGTPFGMGRQVSAVLPPGTHTVTLQVIDGNNNVGEDTVTVTVGTSLYLPVVLKP